MLVRTRPRASVSTSELLQDHAALNKDLALRHKDPSRGEQDPVPSHGYWPLDDRDFVKLSSPCAKTKGRFMDSRTNREVSDTICLLARVQTLRDPAIKADFAINQWIGWKQRFLSAVLWIGFAKSLEPGNIFAFNPHLAEKIDKDDATTDDASQVHRLVLGTSNCILTPVYRSFSKALDDWQWEDKKRTKAITIIQHA